MTVYHRKSGKATSIIARETAPAAATIDMFHGKIVHKIPNPTTKNAI